MFRLVHRFVRIPPWAALCAALLACALASGPVQAGVRRSMPFAPGERLVFDISWTVFHAGEAELGWGITVTP